MTGKGIRIMSSAIVTFLYLMSYGDDNVFAHCDTMDGPVIKAAQEALEKGDVSFVLIWVQKKDEAEIKKAFERTLTVRKLNLQAKELADMYFFETLVRIHRAGEGEPYTGIESAGTEIEPGISAADKAIETGSVDDLQKKVSEVVAKGIRERFNRVMENKKYAGQSIEAGRRYVASYVSFIHYVEKLNSVASGAESHH
ncbi:MAG: DUF6448 family protein [Nitrospirota bacterium]